MNIFKKTGKWILDNISLITVILLTIYWILPILSPILFKIGLDRPAWWIQSLYRFFCHQRPERSFFLFGEKLTYSASELIEKGYWNSLLGYPFIGNDQIGYKVAFCSRCTAVYGSMMLTGIILQIKNKTYNFNWWQIALLILPMLLDGVIQYISEFLFITQDQWGLELAKPFYISNNLTRFISGSLFGLGIGLFIFNQIKIAQEE